MRTTCKAKLLTHIVSRMPRTYQTLHPLMGGVNHCRSHCRLVEYPWLEDVPDEIRRCDWLKTNHSLEIHAAHIQETSLRPITSPHSTPIIKPRNFAKRQCEQQWLTPLTLSPVLLIWEGSTTVVYTVVWRNSVVWCTTVNTALWLAEKRFFICSQ